MLKINHKYQTSELYVGWFLVVIGGGLGLNLGGLSAVFKGFRVVSWAPFTGKSGSGHSFYQIRIRGSSLENSYPQPT